MCGCDERQTDGGRTSLFSVGWYHQVAVAMETGSRAHSPSHAASLSQRYSEPGIKQEHHIYI